LLPIFIGANFIEYRSKFLDKLFIGKNTDFGEEWYPEVGHELIFISMNMIFAPFIDFLTEYIDISIHRWY
jgi:hypothetical protein